MNAFDLDAAQERVRAIYADPRLSKHQKHIRSAPIFSRAREYASELEADIKRDETKIDRSRRLIAVLVDMRDGWGVDLAPTVKENDDKTATIKFPPCEVNATLQKNDCSRLHRLADAIATGELLYQSEEVVLMQMPDDVRAFVVSHDWAAVIGDVEGDVVLPYEKCAFEYRVSGRNVIVLALQEEGASAQGVAFYESAAGEWMSLGSADDTFWWRQVRAACIMLDAEVATHHVTRQPHQLNAKRLKAGKTPLYDFHMIDLAHRHRAERSDSASGHNGSHKRLHFCRGHWRHYEKSKTWVRWCLKGDPSLGFVDKEYRL